ncbi:heterokaryon incompatibility protein-domain-containing protein [Nemania sp. NC0429]|nr:heterokaryon incompatibility protein-domain-containing protein [Nemania sp. NC0429]
MAQVDELRPGEDDLNLYDYGPPTLCRAPAYPYRRLIDDDIRLLNILPGHGVLECSLHQMPLAEEQAFRALSYVWGAQRGMEEILLEGRPFKVTKSLYEVLRQLREDQPGPPREIGYQKDYLWIDAICLNQQDVDEKSRQVPRMMEIYEAASVVLIWLGPNRPMTKSEKLARNFTPPPIDAAGCLRFGSVSTDDIVGLLFEKVNMKGLEWDLPADEAEQASVLHEVFGESYNAVVQASAELLQRPWFKRVWTLQECSVGKSTWVISGRHGTHLQDFIKILKVFVVHHRLLAMTPGFLRIRTLILVEDAKIDMWFGEKKLEMGVAECILKLIFYRSGLQATDPRDHLYGVLSFVTYFTGKQLPAELRPDYHSPFEVVYWHYTAYLLGNGADLGLLMTERHNLQGVPSWVPDFRDLGLRMERVSCDPIASVSPDRRTLYLHGIRMEYICDTVCEWYDPRCSEAVDGIHPDLHHRIQYVEERIFKLASRIRNVALEQILDDFLWKACRLFPQGGVEGVRKAYTNLKGYFGRNGPWIPRRERRKTADYFGKNFAIADEIRLSLVLLDDGTILSASRTEVNILPNDLVCVFKGARSAVIIRPSGQGDSFTLITHCDIRSGTFFRRDFDEGFWADKNLEEYQII